MAEEVHERWEMLRRHDQDLYRGNGKPGITSRLTLLEADSLDFKDFIRDTKDNQKWIIRLIVGVLVLAILNLVMKK